MSRPMATDPSRRTVAITGANGFIGSNLVRHFSARGWNVLALCRDARAQALGPGVTSREFSLPNGARDEDLAGGDVLIHCALVRHSKRSPDSDAINTLGTERLFQLSRRLGYGQFVFLSSLSAHDQAESHYGRHKRELERLFDPARDLIVRPGLTLGNGGLARSMVDAIRRSRFVPLVGGGRQPVYTIGVDELCDALYRMVERGTSGAHNVAALEPVTVRELYAGLARKAGVRCVFVPVPDLPVFVSLTIVEKLGVELPITTENLLGLRQLRTFDLAGDLKALDLHPRSFAETLRTLDFS